MNIFCFQTALSPRFNCSECSSTCVTCPSIILPILKYSSTHCQCHAPPPSEGRPRPSLVPCPGPVHRCLQAWGRVFSERRASSSLIESYVARASSRRMLRKGQWVFKSLHICKALYSTLHLINHWFRGRIPEFLEFWRHCLFISKATIEKSEAFGFPSLCMWLRVSLWFLYPKFGRILCRGLWGATHSSTMPSTGPLRCGSSPSPPFFISTPGNFFSWMLYWSFSFLSFSFPYFISSFCFTFWNSSSIFQLKNFFKFIF